MYATVCYSLLDTGFLPQFTARAYNKYTNQQTDYPLPVTVIIQDVNDNAPQFSGSLNYAVKEQCPMGKSEIKRDTRCDQYVATSPGHTHTHLHNL